MKCEIELKYKDKKTASVISNSIEPDNKNFVDMEIENSTVKLKASTEEPLQLLHTLDDLLACVTIAEETHNIE